MDALEKGIANLEKHVENIQSFGLPTVVAINSFITDTPEEIKLIQDKCSNLGVPVIECNHWAEGGAGATELAKEVVRICDEETPDFKFLYPDEMSLWDKIKTVAQKIYGADDISAAAKIRKKINDLQEAGFGNLPVCMAKTQYSFSTDPSLKGRPSGFDIPVSDVRLSAGAGFVVVLTGDVMTMPGLPKKPAAEVIDIDENGNVVGLF